MQEICWAEASSDASAQRQNFGATRLVRATGKNIAKARGLVVKHALYRRTGDWFHILDQFPAALLDEHGHIFFESKNSYDEFVYSGRPYGVIENISTKTLTVRNGISQHVGYEKVLSYPLSDRDHTDSGFQEGDQYEVMSKQFERNPAARLECIRIWGTNCTVCHFNFEQAYGDVGNGYIHVHHLVPLSAIRERYQLAPGTDMRPVCPNCHAMIHKRNPPYTIDELRDIIRRHANGLS